MKGLPVPALEERRNAFLGLDPWLCHNFACLDLLFSLCLNMAGLRRSAWTGAFVCFVCFAYFTSIVGPTLFFLVVFMR